MMTRAQQELGALLQRETTHQAILHNLRISNRHNYFSYIILKNTDLHAQGNKILVLSENKALKA